MSQKDIETFKRAVDAINRGDVDALLEELDSEVEWHSAILIELGGGEGIYSGHEGIRVLMRDMHETFTEFPVEYSDVRDLDGCLVALGRIHARGAGSGAEVEAPIGTVAELKDGKGIRIRTFFDHNEALEAAGLSE